MLAAKEREYIRHPSDIPISVSTEKNPSQLSLELNNVSSGGLAFNSPKPLPVGSVVQIKIRAVKPVFKVKAVVVWCEPKADHYEAGVEFVGDDDAYRVRMVEQVCHIEHYKRHIKATEGRKLSGEKAAAEWIQKYASSFPNPQ